MKLALLNIKNLLMDFGLSETKVLHNESESYPVPMPFAANLYHVPENGGVPIDEWILGLFPNCPKVSDIASVYMHWEHITLIRGVVWIQFRLMDDLRRFYINLDDFDKLFEYIIHPSVLQTFVEEVEYSIDQNIH